MLLSEGSSCDELESNCALPSGEKARAAYRCDEGSNTEGVHGHMWVEFVSGSRLCSKRFFYRCTIVSLLFQNHQFHIPTRLRMW